MKKGLHPEYKKAKITCGCGNVIETKTTVGDLSVEICSACHPFFTGKQKLVDTAGRVDKFKARMEQAEKIKASKQLKKKAEKKEENVEKLDEKMAEIKKELEEETVDSKSEEESAEKPNSAEASRDK